MKWVFWVLALVVVGCGEPQRLPVDVGPNSDAQTGDATSTADAGGNDGGTDPGDGGPADGPTDGPTPNEDASAGDSGVADGQVDDGGGDSGPGMDGAVVDAGPVASDCTVAATRNVIDLAPSGPDTQIHAKVVFHDGSLWLAYNQPEANGNFDVYLSNLNCDGTPIITPQLVSTSTRNDVDPTLLIHGTQVWLAWSADDGSGGPNNLDVTVRRHDLQGLALGPERDLEMSRAGRPQPGNAWMPSLAPQGAGVTVAGIWGHDEAPRFQVFIQDLAVDGSTVGEARDVILEPLINHGPPSIARDAAGDLHVAFAGSDDNNPNITRRATFVAGTNVATNLDFVGNGEAPAFSSDASLLAWSLAGANPEIGLQLPSGPTRFGAQSRIDHTPTIAAGQLDGAVAYYRHVAGFRNELVVQYLVFENGAWRLGGEEIVMTGGDVPPYAPAMTRVGAGVYFVAWSAGQSPAFRLRGRFVGPGL